ncbi:MAG: hypothetical protein RR726_40845, partial [Pseudomonas sp.]
MHDDSLLSVGNKATSSVFSALGEVADFNIQKQNTLQSTLPLPIFAPGAIYATFRGKGCAQDITADLITTTPNLKADKVCARRSYVATPR